MIKPLMSAKSVNFFWKYKRFFSKKFKNNKRLYLEYKDEEILPPAVVKLPWTYNVMLIGKIKDKNIRFWYANEATNGDVSKTVLNYQININLTDRY